MTSHPRVAVRGWVPGAPDPDDEPDDEPGDGTRPAAPDAEPDPPFDERDPDRDEFGGGVRRHRPPWWRRFGRGGRFVETWVPESLRDARVDPGRRGALVLSLVAALAAVAAAIGVWRDRPEPRPVQAISHVADATAAGSGESSRPEAPPAAPGGRSGRTEASSGPVPSATTGPAPAVLAVSVTGAVRRPGLVRVPNGSRVADAIAAAGGTTADADITGLNVATVLVDGDSVVVGTVGAPIRPGDAGTHAAPGSAGGPPGGSTGPGTSGLVDLNSADGAALEELPGVGPVMAGNIIAWRDANGPFTTVDQLREISGIGPARYAQLAPLVIVG